MLRLTFIGRSRLWAELVNTGGQHVFIATTEPFVVGSAVSLEVEAPELWAPLVLTARVESLRPLAGRVPAGILVSLDHTSLARVKSALSATTSDAPASERIDSAVECHYPAFLLSPTEASGFVVKSLSTTTATLKLGLPLVLRSQVSLRVTPPSGEEVMLEGTVAWVRDELQLAGLTLSSADPQVKARLLALMGGAASNQAMVSHATRTVLVADDEPSVRVLLTQVLIKQGYRVVTAERGDEALKVFKHESPHLVLADVLMPGMDGLELCRAIRALSPQVPVVLLSAMGDEKLSQAVRDVKANDALSKPVQLAAIRALAARYL